LTAPLITNRTYQWLFALLGLVYIAGLFVPLMDNDAGHHAAIALHMYLTGDYVNLIDYQGDYIDKPHFLFWTSALSYHVFGITSFAYRFPTFLFMIGGIYSIFRLGKELYDAETGKLAALLAASSFCVMLACTDVRMDGMLSAFIAFASWQLVGYVHHRKTIYLLGAALGLALAFSTKGHVGLVTPVAGLFFYILYRKEWKLLYDWHWLIVIVLFGILISPVVYCYYLQFNLHPEKVIKGVKEVNGVRFILWSQNFERFGGNRFGADGSKDKFFFVHTFLWTFAPWCLAAYTAFGKRIKELGSRKEEWFTTGTFLLIGLLISFSSFKLPHYLPIIAPATAVMVARLFTANWHNTGWRKALYIIQVTTSILLVLLATLVNLWAFPLKNVPVIIGAVLLLGWLIYLFVNKTIDKLRKAICLSAGAMILLFFLLNLNFYPRLLSYQAGKPLADKTRGIVDPNDVYYYDKCLSFSYDFYSGTFRKVINDSLQQNGSHFWLMYMRSQQENIDSMNFRTGRSFAAPDFEITRMNGPFINPKTRAANLDEMRLVEVLGRK